MLESVYEFVELIRQELRLARDRADLEERIRRISPQIKITACSLGCDWRFVTVERNGGGILPEGPLMVAENPLLDVY